MEQKTDLLLEELQELAKCPYLSDLHSSDYVINKRIKELIFLIPDGRYTPEEWSKAVSYINCNALIAFYVQI